MTINGVDTNSTTDNRSVRLAESLDVSSLNERTCSICHNVKPRLCILVCVFSLEGSAMMELAFDIASGSNFKFNTGFLGEQARRHGTVIRHTAFSGLCERCSQALALGYAGNM